MVDQAMTDAGQTQGGPEREVPMSSNPASDGVFFVDQQPPAEPAPAPVAPVAAAPPEPEPEPAAPVGGAMRDVPLGTLIFRAGLLAEEQLEDALQEGMRTGKRLGEVLAARGLIKDTDLGRLLAGQQGLPFVEAATLTVDPAALARLPQNIAQMQNALAFGIEDGVPVVAVADPTNELVVENVRRALGVEPRLVVAAHGELAKKIQEAYSAPQPVVEAAPAPQPEPEPAPAVEAPVVEQPAAAPAVTPMPTTVPPAEERAPEPAPAVEPVAPPAATTEISPLHAQAAAEPPLAPEPAAPAPAAAPVPQVAPAPPVAEAPAAPPPAEPAPAMQPPVEQPPVAQPPAEQPAQPAEPGLFAQAAEEALAQPVTAPEPPPAVEQPAPAPAAAPVEPTHVVVLRLTDADRIEIGGFVGPDEAEAFARTIVGRISRAEEQAEWPLFGDRFIRPQSILSVDVVERAASSWSGSATRSRWAETPPA